MDSKTEHGEESRKKEENYDSDATQKNLNINDKNKFENNQEIISIISKEEENTKDEIMGDKQEDTSNTLMEPDNSQGLILRSKFLADSSSNDDYGAVEIYSNFKKLNVTDFQNMHRKL